MNPNEKQGMRELIERLNADGLTILLIDHDMRLVMGVCKRVAVLNFGKKIADGTPEEVSTDATVIKAYLGTGGEREVTSAPGASGVAEETDVEQAASTSRAAREPDNPILDVENLTVSYGAIVAANSNRHRRFRRGILYCVVNQLLHGKLHQPSIKGDHRQLLIDPDFERPIVDFGMH